IRSLTFEDALTIVRGDKNAATQYLQRTTYTALVERFRPPITQALQRVDATKYWADIMGTYNQIPLVQKVDTDLAGYVTDQAINGLFQVVEAEERHIRENPAA
ncbi:DUF4197 domain-containing protein, partial [Arthrospira platensis SPKY1]|nr:DUF4197 domain-containing protein [Arthrospira platensis SPKY1]